jgi:hypothetical protein
MEAEATARDRWSHSRLDLAVQNFRDGGGAGGRWTTEVRGETAGLFDRERTEFALADEAAGTQQRGVEIG